MVSFTDCYENRQSEINKVKIRFHDLFVAPKDIIDADLAERMSAMKRPGESDMDFFERRYQERVSYNLSDFLVAPCTSLLHKVLILFY